MIKTLIVENSQKVRELMIGILKTDPSIQLVGEIYDGKSAVEFVKKSKPDIVIMSIDLPNLNGIEATRIIMETSPVPIIIAGSGTLVKTFNGLEVGAVAVVERPESITSKNYSIVAENFIKKVKLMSEIKVVKRIPSRNSIEKANTIKNNTLFLFPIRIIAIGASTGGPVILEQILSSLPTKFSIPILIIQHIAAGFTQGLVEWLNLKSSIPVKIAEHNEKIAQGKCYVAPEGMHLKLNKNHELILSDEKPINNVKPSISVLFQSVADNYGKEAVGILLSGMGKDGAKELNLLKQKGAVTIAQDKKSSLIFGMPGEAIRLNAASYIYSPKEIIHFLKRISN